MFFSLTFHAGSDHIKEMHAAGLAIGDVGMGISFTTHKGADGDQRFFAPATELDL